MKTRNVNEWAPIRDGDQLEFDGGEPTHVAIRSLGAAALYLVHPDGSLVCVGVGATGEWSCEVHVPGPHKLQLALQVQDLPASYKARSSRHTQPDLAGSESLVVIKPRMQESEEMRAMRWMLIQQQQRFERQLTELHNAGNLNRTDASGATRVPGPDGSVDGAAADGDVDGDGVVAPA